MIEQTPPPGKDKREKDWCYEMRDPAPDALNHRTSPALSAAAKTNPASGIEVAY